MSVTALAGWHGGNRMLASSVGVALDGCSWVAVLFAGSMAEVPHIRARTILCNDQHTWIINLARVVANDALRQLLIRQLSRKCPLHPVELADAQAFCKTHVPIGLDLDAAVNYFVTAWMGRASRAGTKSEFDGAPAIRWNAGGGDSTVRYFSAIRALVPFSQSLRRCTFETKDAFEILERCEDASGVGVYADPPFPEAGRKYTHNAGQTEVEERQWHIRLRDALERFTKTRVVCRFYDHPLIRELYSAEWWDWRILKGRKQSNEAAPEVLLVNRASMSYAEDVARAECPGLFTEAAP